MKNKPCAYCGSIAEDNPRTKGHVLQRSLFPEKGFESVQRITVPECIKCKAVWQDAEDEFRSIVVLGAEGNNDHANEKWDGPVNRSFQRKEDGIRRIEAMMKSLARRQTSNGEDLRLFPHRSEKVNLVVKKMVRGLCHYHGLATQVHDQAILANPFPNSPPDHVKSVVEFNYLPGVFRYSYFSVHLQPQKIHLHFLLTFYERVSFLGMVSTKRHLEWEATLKEKPTIPIDPQS
jgi:hypothetical protein